MKDEIKKEPFQYPPVFLTVWQDAWVAITRPRQYLKWAFQPFWRSVKYLMILSAVMSLVATAYFLINLQPALRDFQEYARTSIPQVDYMNGQLVIEDDQSFIYTDSDTIFFKVDPTLKLEDQPRIDTFYEQGTLFTRDGLIRKTAYDDQAEVLYADILMRDFSFSGNSIADWIDTYLFGLAIVFIPVLVFLYTILAKLFYTAFFAGMITVVSGLKLDFVQVWTIAIYALTPAILIGYLSFIFFPIDAIYTTVFIIYLIMALGHYRRFQGLKDKINQQS